MTVPHHKSRTMRRVYVRTPGGNVVLHHKLRRPAYAECGGCHKNLQAVPRERPAGIQALAKAKRRPERPYGGVLCGSCMRKTMVAKGRMPQ